MPRTNRRGFVQQSAALGLGLTAGLSNRAFASNDKISVACIGVRGRGNGVMHQFANQADCEVTHICDVRESMRQQRGAGRTVLYSTHLLADAEDLCDRFGILHDGEIKYLGTPSQCLQAFDSESLEQAYMRCITEGA